MDTTDPFLASRLPTSARPLLGLTVLVVEDSRFASEALRLICLRSGARIRRADTLAHARRHLMVYRPGCIIVDLGLPDGSGADLIAELAGATPRIDIILGTSGDPGAEAAAIAAGADGFLEKPFQSVAAFQSMVLALMPAQRRPHGPRVLPTGMVTPDAVAYRDDLHHAAGMLATAEGAGIDYVTQFLGGVARSAGDIDLTRAVADLAAQGRCAPTSQDAVAPDAARRKVAELVRARIAAAGPI